VDTVLNVSDVLQVSFKGMNGICCITQSINTAGWLWHLLAWSARVGPKAMTKGACVFAIRHQFPMMTHAEIFTRGRRIRVTWRVSFICIPSFSFLPFPISFTSFPPEFHHNSSQDQAGTSTQDIRRILPPPRNYPHGQIIHISNGSTNSKPSPPVQGWTMLPGRRYQHCQARRNQRVHFPRTWALAVLFMWDECFSNLYKHLFFLVLRLVYMDEEDGLVHFYWKNRTTKEVEEVKKGAVVSIHPCQNRKTPYAIA